MSEEKNIKVNFADEDHIWIDGNQFISLNRFLNVKKDSSKELRLLNEKNIELTKENEAMKVLLKNQLNNVGYKNEIMKFAKYLKNSSFCCDSNDWHSFQAIDTDDLDELVENYFKIVAIET